MTGQMGDSGTDMFGPSTETAGISGDLDKLVSESMHLLGPLLPSSPLASPSL